MLTDIKDIQVFENSQGVENMRTMLEDNFHIDHMKLFSLMEKHGGMISGGLPLTTFISKFKEEILSYTGDCDLWIPIIEADDELDFNEKFHNMKNYIDIFEEFRNLFSSHGYIEKNNNSLDLISIGRSLRMYYNYQTTIKQLREAIRTCPLMRTQIQSTIDEVIRISESEKSECNFRNAHNNRRLSLLFPERSEEEWDELDSQKEIRRKIESEENQRECDEYDKFIKSIDITEDIPIYNVDIISRDNIYEILNGNTNSMYNRRYSLVTICVTKEFITNNRLTDFNESCENITVVVLNKGVNNFYLSKKGYYLFVSDMLIEEELVKPEFFDSNDCIKNSIDRKIRYFTNFITSLNEEMSCPCSTRTCEVINKMIYDAEKKLEFYENERKNYVRCLNEIYYKQRLGFDKIFRIIRFTLELENGDLKEIQLIFTHVSNHKMLQLFDLSFCATGFDGRTFHCMEPELTMEKIGYRVNYRSWEREKARSIKYINRGFTIYKTSEIKEEDLITSEMLDIEVTLSI
jgi:hypothetical protein